MCGKKWLRAIALRRWLMEGVVVSFALAAVCASIICPVVHHAKSVLLAGKCARQTQTKLKNWWNRPIRLAIVVASKSMIGIKYPVPSIEPVALFYEAVHQRGPQL